MQDEDHAALGAYLTANEAYALAVRLGAGKQLGQALTAVSPSRRPRARELLEAVGAGQVDQEHLVAMLHAISGAKSVLRDLSPVWTMPGNEATVGRLTSEFHRLVGAARLSVTCATYNFEQTSQMWETLRGAAAQPGVVVTVYIDGDKANGDEVQAQLPGATVYRSIILPMGKRVVSHAKFVVIDHEILLLTSANFSYSAENRNVEFGLLIHDSALARSVEATMVGKHGILYELI